MTINIVSKYISMAAWAVGVVGLVIGSGVGLIVADAGSIEAGQGHGGDQQRHHP